MNKLILQNLDCAHCASELESHLQKLEFVKSAVIHFPTLTLTVNTTDLEKVKAAIVAHEPDIIPKQPVDLGDQDSGKLRQEGWTMLVLGTIYLTLLIFDIALPRLFPQELTIGLYLVIYGLAGWTILRAGLRKILKGDLFEENFLMATATITALILGAWAEAAGVMVFFRTGEFFQNLALARSRRSLTNLLALRPDTARVITEDNIEKITDPSLVPVGSKVLVLPGEKIPLDGIIIEGITEVDSSALTGESLPQSCHGGTEVQAGVMNLSGRILIRSTRVLAESSIQKILSLVEEATGKKGKVEQFFSRFAKVYTPAVFVIAFLTALLPPLFFGQSFSDWIYRALVVLMVSCPCALVISIPLTYFGGLGAASRQGILIKGGQFLDTLGKIKALGFDKTGTLTQGKFTLLEERLSSELPLEETQTLAGSMGAGSRHPAALALASAYPERVSLQNLEEIPGLGVRAFFNNQRVLLGKKALLESAGIQVEETSGPWSETYLALDNRWLASFRLGDKIKPSAPLALGELRSLGVEHTLILSGDREPVVAAAARELGISNFKASLLPEGKFAHWEAWKKNQGGLAAFVGDGINDAPVLAASDLGVAMGTRGIDAALESADVVLMNDDLSTLPKGIKIARKTQRILWQNIALAMGIKLFFIVLGLTGLGTMWEAVFADVGVALLAIGNSLRILRT